jgi:glycosyltransferase involved in cell wall biosynthesis
MSDSVVAAASERESGGKPVVWLLSAYRADSHAWWADWLTGGLDDYAWRRLELPGRYFSWRIRGNPLSWLEDLDGDGPDLLVATSMVDLATIRGLHPALAGVPALYYFHENQFAYPRSGRQVRSLEPQMVQLYGALAADRCVFNSRYNRDTFLAGVDELLAHMPDRVPPGVSARIAERAEVLPVPVAEIRPSDRRERRLILWNHRWEYDKAPGLFCDAIIELAESGTEFELALLGPRPAPIPVALARLRERFADRIRYDGRVDRDDYRAIVARAGVVVSTAIHEFQGVAVLEAVGAGAVPVVPDALCYREQYPVEYRYPAGDAVALAGRLRECLLGGRGTHLDIKGWSPTTIKPRWQRMLAELARVTRGR